MTTRKEVEKFIFQLETEAEELDANSFIYSEYREEIDRLQALLDRDIIPQDISQVSSLK